MNYYVSDMHFDHTNILKYCKRPWATADEMNEALVKNWNERVSNNDHVYHLGDFCFDKKRFVQFALRLNGIKHFILGNHDPHGVQHVPELKHMLFHPAIHEVKDNGRKLVLCHYPIHEWNGYYHTTQHLHGHCHGTIGKSFKKGAYDVACDLLDYAPRTLDEIVQMSQS